ncbi:MAG TPA: helix-turn-helix transcriptional regulator [Ohtaekwangia sp.]|uniref:helix-turn-helix domain-containing protein n=1 Tax=Ohtaekwangia sp. TaxID=2066019 RepID=UPI002F937608
MPPILKHPFDQESKIYITKVGAVLQCIRESKNIELSHAARSMGISSNRLQGIESGAKDYSIKLLFKICDYYEVSVLDVV